ncbi:DUF3307 domain-containing protein [Rhizobium sp. BK176]|uniref:DUF3307 domain-containing protein n=1 Tax=Rhizobium sp. BK176 TaxID=2587071 RepID=UPI002167B6FD|nr:DUF3307 domain-containing protein [Rhizobium sp. BK176]MCS4088632.1 hypothetical protein [Rhizobium sp. BK176]
MEPQHVVFLLLAGHFFGDYAFQSAFIACGKNRKKPLEGTSWFHPMLAHCYIHGTFVYFFTGGCLTLALLEIVCHFAIDDAKCNGRFGEHVDQALHIGCKLLWALLLFQFKDYLPW